MFHQDHEDNCYLSSPALGIYVCALIIKFCQLTGIVIFVNEFSYSTSIVLKCVYYVLIYAYVQLFFANSYPTV